jgi:hypothetical protein
VVGDSWRCTHKTGPNAEDVLVHHNNCSDAKLYRLYYHPLCDAKSYSYWFAVLPRSEVNDTEDSYIPEHCSSNSYDVFDQQRPSRAPCIRSRHNARLVSTGNYPIYAAQYHAFTHMGVGMMARVRRASNATSTLYTVQFSTLSVVSWSRYNPRTFTQLQIIILVSIQTQKL